MQAEGFPVTALRGKCKYYRSRSDAAKTYESSKYNWTTRTNSFKAKQSQFNARVDIPRTIIHGSWFGRAIYKQCKIFTSWNKVYHETTNWGGRIFTQ